MHSQSPEQQPPEQPWSEVRRRGRERGRARGGGKAQGRRRVKLCQILALSLRAPVPDLVMEVMTDKATHPIVVCATGSSVMAGLKYKQVFKGREGKRKI